MKYVITFLLAIGCIYPIAADEYALPNNIELSSGFSMLLYQSVFSFQDDIGLEIACRGPLSGQIDWQVGARYGLTQGHPEAFGRLLAAPSFGAWHPVLGVELGMTNRAQFGQGDKLLRETRLAMQDDISSLYVAVHAAPLSFHIRDQWRISVLDIQIGTHVDHIGRTLRVQAGLLTIGRTL